MGLLDGKNALIFGLANERSIAWGITQAFKREGANLGISYAGEALERRVKPLAEQVGCKWVEECDVTRDDRSPWLRKRLPSISERLTYWCIRLPLPGATN
jgi:enoyl-[acyl-carrier protein] reductase I